MMTDQTQGHPTREAAIEAWNTWRGRYVEVDPETFCRCNPCNAGGAVVDDDGKYAPFHSDDIVGGSQMLANGAFTVPWPRLAPPQAAAAEKLLDRRDALAFAASLTARWCALFPSIVEYRSTITELLQKNDPDNKLLNRQLEKWNEYLSSHCFTPFEENDLRGINLSGLRLEGDDYSGTNLRYVDLSFSEGSVCQLRGANLYGATVQGMSSVYLNLSFSIAASADFSHSSLSVGHFEGADLGGAQLQHSLCHHSYFDGASLRHADFSHARCTDISLKPLILKRGEVRTRKSTEVEGLIWDETAFAGTSTDEIDWIKNPALKAEIDRQNAAYAETPDGHLWNRVVRSTELKPGWLGFSIDLKQLFKRKAANKAQNGTR